MRQLGRRAFRGPSRLIARTREVAELTLVTLGGELQSPLPSRAYRGRRYEFYYIFPSYDDIRHHPGTCMGTPNVIHTLPICPNRLLRGLYYAYGTRGSRFRAIQPWSRTPLDPYNDLFIDRSCTYMTLYRIPIDPDWATAN